MFIIKLHLCLYLHSCLYLYLYRYTSLYFNQTKGAVEFLESWEGMVSSLAVVFDRQPKYAWIMKQVRTLRYVHTLMYL